MITELAKSTACFFVKNKLVDPNDEEIYAYGMEIFLSTLINLIVMITIAVITKTFIPCINFTTFVTLRIYAGGYHADTHLGCIMTLITVQTVFIFIIKIIPITILLLLVPVFIIISLITIFFLSTVEHPNKPLDSSLKSKLRKKSLVVMVLWLIFITVCMKVGKEDYSFYASFGMFSISLAMILEKIKLRYEK